MVNFSISKLQIIAITNFKFRKLSGPWGFQILTEKFEWKIRQKPTKCEISQNNTFAWKIKSFLSGLKRTSSVNLWVSGNVSLRSLSETGNWSLGPGALWLAASRSRGRLHIRSTFFLFFTIDQLLNLAPSRKRTNHSAERNLTHFSITEASRLQFVKIWTFFIVPIREKK